MQVAPKLLFQLPVLALGLALVPGCSGCDKHEQVTSELPSPNRQLRPVASGAMRRQALGGFRQRLEEEAQNRPPAPLKAEDILAAIEKDGVVLDRKRQQMASPHFAKYCMSAHTGTKVQLTVCEHESEERAAENVTSTQKLERPERRIAKNGMTTLLVRRELSNDSETPLVEKILRSYERIGQADHD